MNLDKKWKRFVVDQYKNVHNVINTEDQVRRIWELGYKMGYKDAKGEDNE